MVFQFNGYFNFAYKPPPTLIYIYLNKKSFTVMIYKTHNQSKKLSESSNLIEVIVSKFYFLEPERKLNRFKIYEP